MATIGVEGVEIRIYKANQLIETLLTDVEGRASTMLEANTYRAEYWYEERKIGEYTFTLEVDSYVFWAFPAILMAVIKELPIKVELVEVKLGDVVKSLPLTVEVEAKIPPEFYPSLKVEVEVKLGDVAVEHLPTQTVDAKLGDVTASQSLSETVSAV